MVMSHGAILDPETKRDKLLLCFFLFMMVMKIVSFPYIIGCLLQVVIIPIWKKAEEKTGVINAALSVKEALQKSGIKVKLDDSEQRTPGWKFNFWEMKVFCHSQRSKIYYNSLVVILS